MEDKKQPNKEQVAKIVSIDKYIAMERIQEVLEELMNELDITECELVGLLHYLYSDGCSKHKDDDVPPPVNQPR